MPTTRATKEAAQMLGVSVSTMRNWSDQYAEYLSETARPGHLPERRFTDKDMTILSYVKQLRSEGMQADQIRTRIDETAFNEVEVITQQTTTEDYSPQQTAPEIPQATQALVMVVQDLQRQMTALQQARQEERQEDYRQLRDGVFMFGAGVIVALLIMLILIGLAWLYGG
jgi:DNA-binding transcriptional MerR regulator